CWSVRSQFSGFVRNAARAAWQARACQPPCSRLVLVRRTRRLRARARPLPGPAGSGACCRAKRHHVTRPSLQCNAQVRPLLQRCPAFVQVVVLVVHGDESAERVIQAALRDKRRHAERRKMAPGSAAQIMRTECTDSDTATINRRIERPFAHMVVVETAATVARWQYPLAITTVGDQFAEPTGDLRGERHHEAFARLAVLVGDLPRRRLE